MDAKSKANFINSVASGVNVPCPKCGANNKTGSQVCISCGTEITVTSTNNEPAFKPAKEKVAPTKGVKYVGPNNIFAQGLPAWNIEPPQVMVRRH